VQCDHVRQVEGLARLGLLYYRAAMLVDRLVLGRQAGQGILAEPGQ
jgi:hypothetical protein